MASSAYGEGCPLVVCGLQATREEALTQLLLPISLLPISLWLQQQLEYLDSPFLPLPEGLGQCGTVQGAS